MVLDILVLSITIIGVLAIAGIDAVGYWKEIKKDKGDPNDK